MARTELPNGVILPAEYSDDWYEVMTSNLTKLDDVIGSDSEKLNSNDVAFLRMSSAALTDGGTGNFSDLNSSNKLKTGDYVLDSGRKLYQVVSVDSTNETFTVGNSLFKVTAESDLAPVAESGDYGDLDNKPDLNPYDQHIVNTDIHVTTADKTKWNDNVNQSYVLRYASTSVTPSSTISYSVLNNTDNIKAGDSVIDSAGQVFLIASVDSVNQTVTVSAVLLTLALDANVMHLSGNETIAGVKSFSDNTFIKSLNFTNEVPSPSSSNSSTMPLITTITYGDGSPSVQARLNLRVTANGDKSFYPHENNQYSFGLASRRFKEIYAYSYKVTSDINGINPGALSFPDLNNGLDISGYLDTTQSSINTYTPVVDGWISIKGRSSATSGIVIIQDGMSQMGQSVVDFGSSDRVSFCALPVKAGVQVTIWLKSVTALDSAKFYPNLGNV